MAKLLNFNTLKKQYLPVTLADENQTKLLIGTPTKKVLDDFINIKDLLEDDNAGDEAIAEMYEIVARLMSHNKTGVKITADYIGEIMDYEDITTFIYAYTDFISEIANVKNS